MKRTYNIPHTVAVLLAGQTVYKPDLYRIARDHPKYRQQYMEEMRKSEKAFEAVFYDKDGKVRY